MRAQTDLTRTPELKPDEDANGDVVAGPNTDAYNADNPGDDSYQHLTRKPDFEPAIPSYQQQQAGTEPTDATEDAGPHFDAPDESEEDDDEPADDDEPQDDEPTAPNPPRRKARRTGDAK